MKVFEHVAMGVFLTSCVVHLLAFSELLSLSMDQVWILHVLTMVVFVAAVFQLSRMGTRLQWPGTDNGLSREEIRKVRLERRRAQKRLVWRSIPFGVKVLAGVLVLYAGVNFLLFMMQMEGGGPHASDGHFYLSNHGNILRELSRPEFDHFQLMEVRGFSGHWMAFSFAAWTLLHFVAPVLSKPEQQTSL